MNLFDRIILASSFERWEQGETAQKRVVTVHQSVMGDARGAVRRNVDQREFRFKIWMREKTNSGDFGIGFDALCEGLYDQSCFGCCELSTLS